MTRTLTDIRVPKQPDVVKWFRVYCGILCAIYLIMVLYSWTLVLDPPGKMQEEEAHFLGVFLCVTGLVFSAGFIVPFLVSPRRWWLWGYGIGLICVGMTSMCLLPVCVLLLINWIKPQTKAYFRER